MHFYNYHAEVMTHRDKNYSSTVLDHIARTSNYALGKNPSNSHTMETPI